MAENYTLSLDNVDGKVEIGQAVYSLPDGKFYTTSKAKGIPLGYVLAIDGKNVDITIKGGNYRLTLDREVNSKRIMRKNRFQILKES
jgi:hypothetical protein